MTVVRSHAKIHSLCGTSWRTLTVSAGEVVKEMRLQQRGKKLGAGVFTAILLVVVAMLTGASALAGVRVQSFNDPAGDANGGPDIRSIAVSDSNGILTFKLNIAGMKVSPSTGVVRKVVMVFLTDMRGRDEHALFIGADADGVSWDVLKLPSDKSIPESPTLSFVGSGSSYTFKLSSTDLGGTTSFGYFVKTATLDEGGTFAHGDEVPDSGALSYTMTSIKPVIGVPKTTPAKPLAGKAFLMTVPVTRSDSGAKVTTGATITVDPTIGGVLVPHKELLKNGTVSLNLKVPAIAKGKVLTVRVGVKYAGNTTAKTITLPVL
jgi:hypothetical protein